MINGRSCDDVDHGRTHRVVATPKALWTVGRPRRTTSIAPPRRRMFAGVNSSAEPTAWRPAPPGYAVPLCSRGLEAAFAVRIDRQGVDCALDSRAFDDRVCGGGVRLCGLRKQSHGAD